MPETSFDFAGFRHAFENRNAEAWLAFYADDAEWVEYRPDRPACHRRTLGRAAISEYLTATKAWPDVLAIEEPEIDAERLRFRVRISDPDGHRTVELVMLLTEDGRIRRQVDVQVWE